MKMDELKALVTETVNAAIEPLKKEVANPFLHAPVIKYKEGFKEDNGSRFGRLVRCAFLAGGTRDAERMLATAKRHYANDEILISKIEEGIERTKALGTSTGAAGGFTVAETLSSEIIDLLTAKAVIRKAGAMVMPMVGNLSIPRMATGATAYYTGESSNITKSEQTFEQIQLSEKTLAALVPYSNTLLRNSSAAIERIVRDDMARQIALKEDITFLRGDGTSNTPKGISKWLNNSFNANGTVSYTNVNADLAKAVYYLQEDNVDLSNAAWFFHPRSWKYLYSVLDANGNPVFRDEMQSGKLYGFPFHVTTQIPITITSNYSEVYLVAMDQCIIAENEQLMIDVFDQASYDPGTGTLVSAAQRDETLVRAIERHDFALRHPEAACRIDQVTWGV